MSATTPAKREKSGSGSWPRARHPAIPFLIFGGIVFVLAWLAWTFWFAA